MVVFLLGVRSFSRVRQRSNVFFLARARAFSGFLLFPFTSSPDGHNYLLCSGLSVKVFDLYYTVNEFCKWLWFSSLWVKERASQAFTLSFTSFSQGAFCSIAAPWRRSKAAKCGEGKNAKAFTLYALRMNELRPTGEDVKAKKEKLLTYACTRARWPQVVKGREAGCRR